ncbi:MAG: hypothetical protein EP329_14190 [Deltaproteobacteria bacterium]|nr:MAG: hypothetical protein EP329_14190 [Deltaproteobacteria bacterium]
MRPARLMLGTLFLSVGLLVGCGTTSAEKAPEAGAVAAPHVKPHYVKCDPAHPEMPCTPDTPPEDLEAPTGRKPDYVPCDPAHPEMPCTPDAPPADLEAPTGKKPDYVPCDPAHPELPCTPDGPVPAPE